jgi:hypothetical protein
MPYRILCNDVQRAGAQLSPALASELYCFVPLHKIRYGISIGIDAKVPESKKEFEKFFLFISATRSLANNQLVKMELHQMHTIGLKLIFEFLSLQGFVKLVSEMLQAAEAQAIS